MNRFAQSWRWLLLFTLIVLALVMGGYFALRFYGRSQSNSTAPIVRWFNEPSSRAGLITIMEGRACPNAPFILPSDGFIGLLWQDPSGPYTILNAHSGIDIFGDGQPGQIPVYAAYEGYLTRLDNWVSSLIIQHDDPRQPGRPIWTYYTHMAARDSSRSFIVADFPPGTSGTWVEQGTLLGYQGEYNGDNARAVGLHLHFSIVLSDQNGAFLNETRAENTLDPSPYLGMSLNIANLPARPIRCTTPS